MFQAKFLHRYIMTSRSFPKQKITSMKYIGRLKRAFQTKQRFWFMKCNIFVMSLCNLYNNSWKIHFCRLMSANQNLFFLALLSMLFQLLFKMLAWLFYLSFFPLFLCLRILYFSHVKKKSWEFCSDKTFYGLQSVINMNFCLKRRTFAFGQS